MRVYFYVSGKQKKLILPWHHWPLVKLPEAGWIITFETENGMEIEGTVLGVTDEERDGHVGMEVLMDMGNHQEALREQAILVARWTKAGPSKK